MEYIYILTVSLQVCGAIILLISSFVATKTKMYEEIHKKANVGVLSGRFIDDIDISEELKNVYLNRTAFILLAIGYALGVFGSINKTPRWIIALCIAVMSCIISLSLYLICAKLAKKRQEIYKEKYLQNKKNELYGTDFYRKVKASDKIF